MLLIPVIAMNFLLVPAAFCQDLIRQMHVDSLYMSDRVSLEADKALVHVRSTVPNLRFDSNYKIERQEAISTGDWNLWLPAGTHILTISAAGYQQLKLEPTSFGRKKCYELIIGAVGYAPTARADQDLVEVSFQLSVDSVYSCYGSFPPVLTAGRTISYKIPKGQYTFRFSKSGYNEETRELAVSEPVQHTISLAAGGSTAASQISLPGFLVVTSQPSGAEVVVNGQKVGNTPFLTQLTAGQHQLEVRKPLYHPDISTFRLDEGKTVTLERTLKPRFGYLTVTSSVRNSDASIDGKNLGPTPITKRQVESATHIVKVEASLYHTFTEEVTINDGDDKTVVSSLKPAFGSLEVSSMPEEGAQVVLDGQVVGTTPFTNARLPSGKYLLRVTKALFGDAEEEILIEDGKALKRTVTMGKNFGSLFVKAPGSVIYLNNARVASETYTGRLAPGTYQVRAQKEGPFKPATATVILGVGEERTVTLDPEARLGGLTVMVQPFDARDAEVFINGESKGSAPQSLRLLVGEYQILARKNGYLDGKESITLGESETRQVNLILLTYEGSRQQLRDSWGTVKTWTGISGVLAGGAAVYFKLTANSNYDKYNAATTSALAVAYRDKTTKNDNYYKIALGTAGGLLGTALLSWIIQGSL
jgi:hypothetical protein